MEAKHPIFKRVPPGDRWSELEVNSTKVYATLTDALEHYFQKTGNRQYYIDAIKGLVYKIIEVPDPEPEIPRYSIYNDEL